MPFLKPLRKKLNPRYREELEAEKCSFDLMRKNGISVSAKARDRSKHYIAYRTQMALHRGLKEIHPEVKKFIRKEYPETARGEERFV